MNQWHHFKNDEGNRTSFPVKPFAITNENERKTALYSTFLTGSTNYFSFEDYKSDKLDFYEMHIKGFRDLNPDNEDDK